MPTPPFRPTTCFESIIFDCDGTLSAIEGIDELARLNGVGNAVERLTAEAMGQSGITLSLYQHRLDLVKPTFKQLNELANQYYIMRSPEIETLIQVLSKLNKKIIVISAGLCPAVQGFAERLGIQNNNVYAVQIDFDSTGHYRGFDQNSPLVTSHGKQQIVLDIKRDTPQIAYLGDGLNDLAVRDLVTRFIGYGGHFYRKNIQEQCEFYLTQPSMLACLPLLITESEVRQLNAGERKHYEAGVKLLDETLTRSSKTKHVP